MLFKNVKKASAVLLALLLSLSCLLCGCKKTSAVSLTVNGKRLSVNSAVRIGTHTVPMDLYRYCFLSCKAEMEKENADIHWSDESSLKKLREQTLEQLKGLYAIENLADRYGYSLSREELEELDDNMEKTFKNAGGASSYRALLNESFLNQALYARILQLLTLSDKMETGLIGTDKEKNQIVLTEDEVLKAYGEKYCRLNCIYFAAAEEGAEGLTAAQARQKADAAYTRLQKGESFEKVMRDLLGDEAYEQNTQSYYNAAEISENFGVDVLALQPDSYTPVIEKAGGYYIIYRTENDRAYLTENLKSVSAAVAAQQYDELLQKESDALEVRPLAHYDDITPDTLK